MATPDTPKRSAATDALSLLKHDHDKVKRLFREFDSLAGEQIDAERKSELVDEICYALTLHNLLEEEIFYPMVRSIIDDDDMMDDADLAHAGTLELISQLEVMYPGDEHFDATVAILGEDVTHHIEREESRMFDAVRSAGIDLGDLGEQLSARKEQLDEDLSAPPLARATGPARGLTDPHQDRHLHDATRAASRRPPRPPN